MTIRQFRVLDETEQGEAVWNYGVLLGDHLEAPFRYILYQIDGFYVELRYHQEHNVLMGMRAFDDTDELEPYLEQIKSFTESGPSTATVTELRDQALRFLSPETISQIMGQERDQVVILNYTVGNYLRNRMNLWHTHVYYSDGRRVHPDDVTLNILKEIWHLGRRIITSKINQLSITPNFTTG